MFAAPINEKSIRYVAFNSCAAIFLDTHRYCLHINARGD